MAEITQHTLTGDEAQKEYTRPSTMMYCPDCDGWLLRRHRHTHEHDVYESEEAADEARKAEIRGNRTPPIQDGEDEEDDEPREVGGMFNVTFSYSARHSFRVPAADEEQAQKLAKEQIEWGTCHDADLMHTDTRKTETLTEDDDRMEDVPGWPW